MSIHHPSKQIRIFTAALLWLVTLSPAAPAADLLAVIAGGGSQSPTKNGPAIDALLRIPRGIATDAVENIYFADVGGVRKIDANGFISTVVTATGTTGTGDGGAAANATLNTPVSLAIDTSGNLIIADTGDFKIRKIDTSGNISTVAGNGGSGNTGDGGPATAAQIDAFAVSVDQSGALYLLGNTRVRKVDLSGNITTVAGGGTSLAENVPATTASLAAKNMAVDAAGNIYLDDPLAAQLANGIVPVRLRKIDVTTGMIATIAGGGTSSAGDSDGIPALAATILQDTNKNGLAIDSAGNLYFAEIGASQNLIRRMDAATQTISLFLTSDGATATEYASDGTQTSVTSQRNISGVVVNSAGNFYLSTSDGVPGDGSGLILKVTHAGSGSDFPINVQKTALKLNFATTGSDTLSVAGSLTLPATGFTPTAKAVQIFCGNLQLSFTLDTRGKFSNSTTAFKLAGKFKKGRFLNPSVTFTLNLKKQLLVAALGGLGFVNADIAKPGIHLLLPLTIVIDTAAYQASVPVFYTAKSGKGGQAK